MKFEEILQLQFHEKFSKWDKNLRNSTLCAASCDASIVLQCGNFVILLPLPLSQKSREINVFTKNIKNLTLNWFDGRNFALHAENFSFFHIICISRHLWRNFVKLTLRKEIIFTEKLLYLWIWTEFALQAIFSVCIDFVQLSFWFEQIHQCPIFLPRTVERGSITSAFIGNTGDHGTLKTNKYKNRYHK